MASLSSTSFLGSDFFIHMWSIYPNQLPPDTGVVQQIHGLPQSFAVHPERTCTRTWFNPILCTFPLCPNPLSNTIYYSVPKLPALFRKFLYPSMHPSTPGCTPHAPPMHSVRWLATCLGTVSATMPHCLTMGQLCHWPEFSGPNPPPDTLPRQGTPTLFKEPRM